MLEMLDLSSLFTVERLFLLLLVIAVIYIYRKWKRSEKDHYRELEISKKDFYRELEISKKDHYRELEISKKDTSKYRLITAQKDFSFEVKNFIDLEALFALLPVVGASSVDTTSILETIRKVRGEETVPKSDLYAIHGGKKDLNQSDSQPSESQKSSVKNDFSKFRRYWVEGGPSTFNVNHWSPDDAILEKLVLEKLFNNDGRELEKWLASGFHLRNECLRFLSYPELPNKIPEITYQSLFIMIFSKLLRELPHNRWNIKPVNKLKLQAELDINPDSNPGQFVKTVLNGYSDAGVFLENESSYNAISMKIKIEFKNYLRALTEFHSKDQLLIEMMACHQLDPERDYVKGVLTDIFALNVALQSKDGSFYVATRVCDNRAFFIRLLFLLIDLSEEEFKDVVLSHVKVHNSIAKQDENVPSHTRQPQVPTRTSTTQRKGRGRSINKGQQSGGIVDKATVVLDFKADEEVEYFDELFNEHYIWAYSLYGQSYLCEESLRRAGCL